MTELYKAYKNSYYLRVFVVFCLAPFWPAACLLLDFEEGVDVVCKESTLPSPWIILSCLWEVVDFMDILDFVSLFKCCDYFHGGPCASQTPCLVTAMT